MAALKHLLVWGLLAFITLAVLYPNPFGNNPDVITDESYFLTSSLASIQNHTLPGWEFSASGAYYGGPQTYVDTLALIPVVAVVVASSHFSLTAAKVWIAVNTGQLLHVLRLISGLTALAGILLCFLFFRKRKIPPALAQTLTLFLFLLLGNVLVIEFLHTAKMWAFYIVFVAVVSAFFMAQEYYLAHQGKPFIKKETYVALLVWSGVLTFFQSYVGVFSIALLLLYALLLRHITVRDVWKHARAYWYLFILAGATQISFVYRAFEMRQQFAGVATTTAQGTIDWLARLYTPLAFGIESQPLSMLYVLGIFALMFLALYKRSFFADPRKRRYIAIACVHPVVVYLFFYVGIGFDVLPRYAILLTLACSFSAAILMGEIGPRWTMAALACSAALFVIVNVHGIELYWRPSSETVLLQTIEAKYNTPTTVFISDHSARRLTLPVNYPSLLLLDQARAQMSRFAFLLQHSQLVQADRSFEPITLTAYLDAQMAADIAAFATTSDSVWIISSDCKNLCTAPQTQAGTCFEINTNACGVEPQEVNTLPVFLSSTQLGYSYIVRRVH